MWMAVFAQVNFTLEIYSKIKISGNVCRKRRKQMGQETFQWSVLFLPVSHKWDPSTAIDLLIVKPCWWQDSCKDRKSKAGLVEETLSNGYISVKETVSYLHGTRILRAKILILSIIKIRILCVILTEHRTSIFIWIEDRNTRINTCLKSITNRVIFESSINSQWWNKCEKIIKAGKKQ